MIGRVYGALIRRLRKFYWRGRGVRIDGPCWLQPIEVPRGHRSISLSIGVALDRGVTLLVSGEMDRKDQIQIEESVYINRHTMIDASESIRIGRQTMIGPYCYITDHDHGCVPGVPVSQQPLVSAPVVIESDVWIGAHAVILKGVTIGREAVVAAGAVVTKSIEPGTVVAGVPARPVKRREA